MSAPTFGPVDHGTASLLDLLAETNPALPITADEWDWFLHILREAAQETGVIDQNDVRPKLRGKIRPARIGAFYRRACLAGFIRADGWTESDDLAQRNRGKPMRRYRWLGTLSPASTTLPPGQAGPDPFAADAVGAPASEGTPGALEGVNQMRNDTSW